MSRLEFMLDELVPCLPIVLIITVCEIFDLDLVLAFLGYIAIVVTKIEYRNWKE